MADVEKQSTHKFAILGGVIQQRLHRFSIGYCEAQSTHRFQILNDIEKQSTHRFRVSIPVIKQSTHRFAVIGWVSNKNTHRFAVKQGIIKQFTHRFSVSIPIIKQSTHKFAILGGVIQEHVHRFSIGYCEAQSTHRFQILNDIEKQSTHRFRVLDKEQLTGGKIKKVAAKITIYMDGSSKVLDGAIGFSISRSKNQPLKWSVEIFDPDGFYNPRNGTEWSTWFDPRLPPIGAPSKWISITIYTESGSVTYSYLLILTHHYDYNSTGGGTLKISGADYSHVLYRENQTKETILSKKGTTYTAKYIINKILNEYGMHGELYFPDFPVAQFDIQIDKPINRIQTLLNEVGVFWQAKGKRFIAQSPIEGERPDWNYKDSDSIYNISSTEQIIEHFNKVTVCRITKNADLAFRKEGDDLGRFNGSFSGIFFHPHFKVIDDFGCHIENIDWFLNGIYVGHGFQILGFADEVYWSVEGLSSPHNYIIEVRGIPKAYLGTEIDIDAKYEYEDAASINLYGELPAPNIESNFTPNNVIAEIKAKAFMREHRKKKRSLSIGAPINCYLGIGETIFVEQEVIDYADCFNIESITTEMNGFEGEDKITMVKFE